MPLALILMLLFGGGATLVVDSSLPGDALHPLELNVTEKLESALAITTSAKRIVNEERARERAREMKLLVKSGKIVDDSGLENENEDNESEDDDGKSSTAIKATIKSDDDENRGIKSSSNTKVIKIEDSEEDDEDEDEDYEDVAGSKLVSTPIPTQTVSANTTQATFTLSDVSKHNRSTDCYSVVRGSVYDLTSWIKQHPGGSGSIVSMCGIDATSDFVGQHGGQGRPESELASFKIGVLK